MIGVASGSINPLQPLSHFQLGQSTQETSNLPQALTFKPVKGLKELKRELAAARTQNKPVLLDFYADWCISCKEMEHLTFADAKVQQQLTHFILLQADVTPNDEKDQALYKQFGIHGPPAVLFFDSKGQEKRAYRVVGFMPAEPFNQHLKQVLQP
jgi:thiol:disulfide interchange protein DsbD